MFYMIAAAKLIFEFWVQVVSLNKLEKIKIADVLTLVWSIS